MRGLRGFDGWGGFAEAMGVAGKLRGAIVVDGAAELVEFCADVVGGDDVGGKAELCAKVLHGGKEHGALTERGFAGFDDEKGGKLALCPVRKTRGDLAKELGGVGSDANGHAGF